MEIKCLVIGIGAGGNKSVINLVESNVIGKEDIVLINSTTMDVPDEYKSITHVLPAHDPNGGFGKERKHSKQAMMNELETERFDVTKHIRPEHKFVAIVASTEGGTGSGAATMLAKYMVEVVKFPTHLIGFTGFGTDGRGLENTMGFMYDIPKGAVVNIIRNDRFLQEAGSQIRAEKRANEQLCKLMIIKTGQLIKESTQNIDPRDMYKTANMPGYQICEYVELEDRIRNRKDFDTVLTQACDESHAMQCPASMGRLAVIQNLNENSQLYTDNYAVLRERYGTPYEEFTHRQHEPGNEYIAFVCSGMKMPIDEVKEVYERYQRASEAVDKTEDDFFSEVRRMQGNSEDTMFDTQDVEINSGNKAAFFASLRGGNNSSDLQKPAATTPTEEY